MKIVCVAACPVSVVHPYMAEEALVSEGQVRQIDVKVETQGGGDCEHALSDLDIQNADIAIIASDVDIQGRDRFKHLPILECSIATPIKYVDELFDTLVAEMKAA
jgi:fructose-specific PTS system IIB-like component